MGEYKKSRSRCHAFGDGLSNPASTNEEELRGYGDPSSNAEAMDLKRAALKFGLALYLYQK
jgi:hypothetical protein